MEQKGTVGFKKNQTKRKWFDDECKTAIEQRRAIDTRDPNDIEEYREERRKIKEAIGKFKRQYLNQTLEQIIKKTP